jgi:hypothetical protein
MTRLLYVPQGATSLLLQEAYRHCRTAEKIGSGVFWQCGDRPEDVGTAPGMTLAASEKVPSRDGPPSAFGGAVGGAAPRCLPTGRTVGPPAWDPSGRRRAR